MLQCTPIQHYDKKINIYIPVEKKINFDHIYLEQYSYIQLSIHER
jgi:hypothetical protein